MYRKISLLLVLMMLLLPNVANAQNPGAPPYARYCDRTLRENTDQALKDALAAADPILSEIDNFLSEFENGNRTYLEGGGFAEGLLTDWNNTPKVECLVPFNSEVTRLLNELLIAMLYGQTTDVNGSATHLNNASGLLLAIRDQVAAAQGFLDVPLPTPTTPPEPTEVPAPTEEPTPELRASDVLTPMLDEMLRTNGVSVLIDAAIQVFPGDSLIIIRLDRFTAEDGRTFDFDNTLFTFDRLAEIIADWPETQEVARIAIETYDGAIRTLYAETEGEAFRDYYYNQTISEETFIGDLTLEEFSQ